jgi:outer membrane protein assembly factor BamB
LGACPQHAAGQTSSARERLPAPLLPAEEAWSVTLPSQPAAAGVMDESSVYVPLQSGLLVALDRESGATEWSIELAGATAPVVHDGVVYVAGTGGLRAVRAIDGAQLWAAPLAAEVTAPLVFGGGMLLTFVKTGALSAFSASDGRQAWTRPIEAPGSPALATDDASVYVAAESRLTRLALSDGTLVWDQQLGGTLATPLAAGDRVFVGSTDNTFYALDAGTGRLAWRWAAGGDVVGATVDDGLVYVASLDQMLRALRRGNGNQIWKRQLLTRTVAPPSTFGGIVLVSGNDPTLSAFRADTGTPIASFVAADDLLGVPLVDATLEPFRVALIVITRDGRAIGLRPTGMMFRDPTLVPLDPLPGRPLPREPLSRPGASGPDGIGGPAAPRAGR